MERPLRVALLAYRGNMRCGGQGVYLWFLARELARRGHSVDAFVGAPQPDPMPFARRVHDLPNERCWGKWFSQDRRAFFEGGRPLRMLEPLNFYELASTWHGFLPEPFLFSLRALRAVAGELRRGVRYDVVHDVQSLGWGLLGLRAAGPALVSTIHHPLSVDLRASLRRDGSLRESIGSVKFHPVGMQAFVARRLDRIITSSAASARQLTRDFGIHPARLRMLGNGLDTELFRPLPDVERSRTELLCVGRAEDPTKGVDLLIDALPLLPDAVHLTLVDDDSEHSAARRRARRLGCEARVRILGRVTTEELVRLYCRATLVVVPSRYEGFGLPAAEAMACGTPVVASAAGALPEVVRAGGGGLLVPPGDAEALAKAIRSLLEQPALREQLGARARAGVQANFSWPRIAASTEDVYRELLVQRSRAGTDARPAPAAA